MNYSKPFTIIMCCFLLCVITSCKQDISTELQGKHATDDAIKKLNPEIVELELTLWRNSDVSLEGLKSIARLVNVKYVRFSFFGDTMTDPQFAITALDALKGAKGLEKLYLTGEVFTPEVLSHLSELKSLKELKIQDTSVSDWNLVGIEEHPNLESLTVICTGISEKGYNNLCHLPKLRGIFHGGAGMTAQIRKNLRKRRPDIVIIPMNH